MPIIRSAVTLVVGGLGAFELPDHDDRGEDLDAGVGGESGERHRARLDRGEHEEPDLDDVPQEGGVLETEPAPNQLLAVGSRHGRHSVAGGFVRLLDRSVIKTLMARIRKYALLQDDVSSGAVATPTDAVKSEHPPNRSIGTHPTTADALSLRHVIGRNGG